MRKRGVWAIVAQLAALVVVASWTSTATAQGNVQGTLEVDGKPVAITQVYA